jgi:hypothetical protein
MSEFHEEVFAAIPTTVLLLLVPSSRSQRQSFVSGDNLSQSDQQSKCTGTSSVSNGVAGPDES